MKLHSFAASLAALVGMASAASAQTGVCDSNPPTTTQACITAVQNNGGVVNDIFRDVNGLTGPELPVFGTLYNVWQGCPQEYAGSCAGTSNPPYDCPGLYTCATLPPTFANASTYLNALDHLWWQPCRLAVPDLVDVGGGLMCPQFAAGCIADGVGGNYLPWQGLVFDLGGPSNRVAIFAQNDHGPQPCESLEYSVYLTDNPQATAAIIDPSTEGVDPQRWNRAVLTKIFTKGWAEFRTTPNAACGDTPDYNVEDDSFVQVFSLPCGITFRYASIIAGNDGIDFPECAFDSFEAELDAVAGLTEGGAAVCPDADNDLYVDCNCPGAPPVCDCDDSDPAIHPNAPEACNDPDLNCDGAPGACANDLVCYQSICVPKCGGGENVFCPQGMTCQSVPSKGKICVPQDCSAAGCPAGSVCKDMVCVPACEDVVCPGKQTCVDGQCIDPCANILCPAGQLCQGGKCISPCNCFAGDIGCAGLPGTVCDSGGTDTCVPPACVGVTCDPGETCDPDTGACVGFCNGQVKCPEGQKCVEPTGCVANCDGVDCEPGFECNPQNGRCEDASCDGVTCFPPFVCVMGECVDGSGAGGSGGNGAGGDAAGGAASGSGASGGSDTSGDPADEGGCGCRTTSDTGSLGVGLLGLLGLAAGVLRRRGRKGPPRVP